MVSFNVTGEIRFQSETSPVRYTGWRLRYPSEGGNDNPLGMPAVTPAQRYVSGRWAKYISPVRMTESIQRTMWDALKYFNPQADKDRFTKLYKHDVAFTNFNGFERPGDPRANYIKGIDLASALPKLMDGILCAGQLYQGVVEGNTLAMYPGVHAMDASKPVGLQTVLDKGWHFRAVSWHDGFGEDFFPVFGGQFVVPQIINEKATYNLSYFEWWDKDYPPDPLKVGG